MNHSPPGNFYRVQTSAVNLSYTHIYISLLFAKPIYISLLFVNPIAAARGSRTKERINSSRILQWKLNYAAGCTSVLLAPGVNSLYDCTFHAPVFGDRFWMTRTPRFRQSVYDINEIVSLNSVVHQFWSFDERENENGKKTRVFIRTAFVYETRDD